MDRLDNPNIPLVVEAAEAMEVAEVAEAVGGRKVGSAGLEVPGIEAKINGEAGLELSVAGAAPAAREVAEM